MTNKKKIFIIAGESSGDLLGSNIMKALKNNDKNIEINCRGIGGDKMQQGG